MTFVIAEQRDGALNRASWEAIAGAQQLGGPVTIVLPGAGASAAASELAAADCAGVIALEHAALGTYTADGYGAGADRVDSGGKARARRVRPHLSNA
jgi:electron transfer flavoprotein alpha subunit